MPSRNAILSCFILLLISHTALAQQQHITATTDKQPLIIIDTFRTDIKHLIIDPTSIDSINVYKDSASIKKFGIEGQYGVIHIFPKKNTHFILLTALFDKFAIAEKDRRLPLCINQILIKEPQKLRIQMAAVEKVEVTNERRWMNTNEAHIDEWFVNIVTKDIKRN